MFSFYLVYFLALHSLASLSIALSSDADDITLAVRSNCGPTMGSCGSCYGTNFPTLGYGICKQGYYQGCNCTVTCDAYNNNDYCSSNGCEGINDPSGGLGTCTAGYYEGCDCLSVCTGQPGACNANGCQGINQPGGGLGVCTAGVYNGCQCNSICWDHDGDCVSNGCNGVNNVCQGGDYRGCPCGTVCGNLKSQPCDQYGCAGINVPAFGFGVCTAGTYAGCGCTLVCPSENPYCDDPNCLGSNGVCSAGVFNGCYCDTAVAAATVAPSSPPAPSPTLATLSCTATENFLWISYSIFIGVPWKGSDDCDNTFHALQAVVDLTNWQCVEEKGDIRLYFNTPLGSNGRSIDIQLQSCYTTVDPNSINCPDN